MSIWRNADSIYDFLLRASIGEIFFIAALVACIWILSVYYFPDCWFFDGEHLHYKRFLHKGFNIAREDITSVERVLTYEGNFVPHKAIILRIGKKKVPIILYPFLAAEDVESLERFVDGAPEYKQPYEHMLITFAEKYGLRYNKQLIQGWRNKYGTALDIRVHSLYNENGCLSLVLMNEGVAFGAYKSTCFSEGFNEHFQTPVDMYSYEPNVWYGKHIWLGKMRPFVWLNVNYIACKFAKVVEVYAEKTHTLLDIPLSDGEKDENTGIEPTALT